MKRTFRVNRGNREFLRNRKARIERRLAPQNWEAQGEPMLRGGHLRYKMGERIGAVGCGGLGVMRTLVQRLGLAQEIDQNLHLLKVRLPYHESDHVLNLACNILPGGARLEDLELQRKHENLQMVLKQGTPDRERKTSAKTPL
jgi:hypothetical protein